MHIRLELMVRLAGRAAERVGVFQAGSHIEARAMR